MPEQHDWWSTRFSTARSQRYIVEVLDNKQNVILIYTDLQERYTNFILYHIGVPVECP